MKSLSNALGDKQLGNDVVTLDDVLVYLGEFGLYQKGLFMMLMPFCFFYSFVYFTQIFITLVPQEHWCKLPETDRMSVEKLRDIAIPRAELTKNTETPHSLPYSRCYMYDVPIGTILSSSQPNENWPIKRCTSWDYHFSTKDVPYSTVATEFNWVCDEAYRMNLAQSIFFIGAICGGLLFGWVADKYGRIPVLMGTNLMAFVGGMATIFTTTFWQFSFCRFIVGFAFDNTWVIMYILCLEYVGPKWRTFVANVGYGVFYTLACIVMPWMAYFIRDWKWFAFTTSLPLGFVIFTPWILPESIRWLISEGKIEKAVKIMMRIEEVNGTDVPQKLYEDFLDDCMDVAENNPTQETSILDLFKTPRLRNISIILIVAWSIMAMAYDGHIRCLDQLGLDIFTTFTLGSCTEFPAVILIMYTLDIWGRKWTLFATIMISGIATFATCCVPVGIFFAIFAMIGRLFMNAATNIALQYASELLPTVVRGKGVAFIHIMGYVSSIISPFVAYTVNFNRLLPMIILGTVSIFCGILGLFVPETLREQLPQTLLDGELFGIDQNFWDFPCKQAKKSMRTGLGSMSAMDVRSNKHYLHATVPGTRGAELRSSMVSGYTGNEKRVRAIREHMIREGIRPRRSFLAISSTPMEYVERLRLGYREKREREAKDGVAKETEFKPETSTAWPKRDSKKKKVRVQLDEEQ